MLIFRSVLAGCFWWMWEVLASGLNIFLRCVSNMAWVNRGKILSILKSIDAVRVCGLLWEGVSSTVTQLFSPWAGMQLFLWTSKAWLRGEVNREQGPILSNKIRVPTVLRFQSTVIVRFSLLYFGHIRAQRSLPEFIEGKKKVNFKERVESMHWSKIVVVESHKKDIYAYRAVQRNCLYLTPSSLPSQLIKSNHTQ